MILAQPTLPARGVPRRLQGGLTYFAPNGARDVLPTGIRFRLLNLRYNGSKNGDYVAGNKKPGAGDASSELFCYHPQTYELTDRCSLSFRTSHRLNRR